MEKKSRDGLIATIVSTVLNFCVALLKLFIGIVSNSVTIFFDAINNLLDVFGGSLGAVGIGIDAKKSKGHFPFGTSKIEHLVAFIISCITLVFGGLFIFYSVERLLYPLPVYFSWLYFWLLLLTVLVKIGMGVGYLVVYRRTQSPITRALYMDSFMDACITGTLVICYAVGQSTGTILDAVLGVMLGIFIMVMTIRNIIGESIVLVDYARDIDVDALIDEIGVSRESVRVCRLGDDTIEVYIHAKVDNIADIESRYHVTIYEVIGGENE